MSKENETTKNKDIEETCASIMDNIVNYLSDDVYVEKNENMYNIKSFHNDNTNSKKNFIININRSEFQFNLHKPIGITSASFGIGISNNTKDKTYETGNFHVKITPDLFNKHENWLIKKSEEYLLFKMKSLESTLYKDFNIDKKLKRKKINSILNEKKEDL